MSTVIACHSKYGRNSTGTPHYTSDDLGESKSVTAFASDVPVNLRPTRYMWRHFLHCKGAHFFFDYLCLNQWLVYFPVCILCCCLSRDSYISRQPVYVSERYPPTSCFEHQQPKHCLFCGGIVARFRLVSFKNVRGCRRGPIEAAAPLYTQHSFTIILCTLQITTY